MIVEQGEYSVKLSYHSVTDNYLRIASIDINKLVKDMINNLEKGNHKPGRTVYEEREKREGNYVDTLIIQGKYGTYTITEPRPCAGNDRIKKWIKVITMRGIKNDVMTKEGLPISKIELKTK